MLNFPVTSLSPIQGLQERVVSSMQTIVQIIICNASYLEKKVYV